MSDNFDVAVIGAGAAGSLAARQLCARGRRVALLDAGGPFEPLGGRGGSVARDYPIQRLSEKFSEQNKHLFVRDSENPYLFSRDSPFYWIRSRVSGGRLNLWSGECFRMSRADLASWPVAYDELSPDYAKAEDALRIWGHRDGLEEVPDGRIVRAAPLDRNEEYVRRTLGRRGLRVILDRIASYRDGRPFHSHVFLQEAQDTGRLSYFPNSVVTALQASREGLLEAAQGVAKESREPFRVKARAFVLAASTLESTRLLLASGLPAVRRSGIVGRYLMDHVGGPQAVSVEGLFGNQRRRRGKGPWTGWEPGQARQPRWLYVPRQKGRGFCLRVILVELNEFHVYFRVVAFGQPVPRADNRVELAPSVRDRWGSPALRIRFALGAEERDRVRLMGREALRVAESLISDGNGAITRRVLGGAKPGLCNHEVGTCRMGLDPETSFLNPFCRSHGVGNLYVTDGSAFPSLGMANPTLTLMALTLRACRDLVRASP